MRPQNRTPGRSLGTGAGALPTAICDARVTDVRRSVQRLPAFGRQLKAALDLGLRPRAGGGCVIVTSEWNYALAFDPGRVVCPPSDSPDQFTFGFLRGVEVIVLVPEQDEIHGERLVAHIRDAGAKLVVLSVNREDSP